MNNTEYILDKFSAIGFILSDEYPEMRITQDGVSYSQFFYDYSDYRLCIHLNSRDIKSYSLYKYNGPIDPAKINLPTLVLKVNMNRTKDIERGNNMINEIFKNELREFNINKII